MVSAVIVAAGHGVRMQSGTRKQYLLLAGRSVVVRTLQQFDACPLIDQICLVVAEEDLDFCRRCLLADGQVHKPLQFVAGGRERQQSVYSGLRSLAAEEGLVAIHDGVRPLIDPLLIAACIRVAQTSGACVPGIPAYDTIKRVNAEGTIAATLDRKDLWLIQTPQVFRYAIIVEAHARALRDGYTGTDDAALVERLGYPVSLITGSKSNIKVTTAEDLVMAAALIRAAGQ
ncbi:MAG: 2-C-methyl-D-erythritol 4-phosphate cytidylyltransferase [Deltaproteobacteria bacterium]|nr:2-C-methyl-D-erythritol 4-phosphate cytidylyltransferase [Deltaproteobacteria bacterium]